MKLSSKVSRMYPKHEVDEEITDLAVTDRVGAGFYELLNTYGTWNTPSVPQSKNISRPADHVPRCALIWFIIGQSNIYDEDENGTAVAEWDSDLAACEAVRDTLDASFHHVHITGCGANKWPDRRDDFDEERIRPASRSLPDWISVAEVGWIDDGYDVWDVTEAQSIEYLDTELKETILPGLDGKAPIGKVWCVTGYNARFSIRLASRLSYDGKYHRERKFAERQDWEIVQVDYFHCMSAAEEADGRGWLKAFENIFTAEKYIQQFVEP